MRAPGAHQSGSSVTSRSGRNAVSVRGERMREGRLVSAIERTHVIVDARDNVTTLLDEAVSLSRITGGLNIAPGVPFGHKAALRTIAQGEAVIKYGVAIGRATRAIGPGEHVHVHNCV